MPQPPDDQARRDAELFAPIRERFAGPGAEHGGCPRAAARPRQPQRQPRATARRAARQQNADWSREVATSATTSFRGPGRQPEAKGPPAAGSGRRAPVRIIALPDLHGDARSLPLLAEECARADLVVLPGDLTTGGSAEPAARILACLRRTTDRILAVRGNWDGPAVAALLEAEGVGLEAGPRTVGGATLAGLGGSLRGAGAPNEYTEAELAARLAQIEGEVDGAAGLVLVAHQPPLGTRCDRTMLGEHVGSAAVRAFLERARPRLCLTGHIHEGVGVDYVGATAVVNPGPLWMGRYAWVELTEGGVRVEIRPAPQP